VLISSHLLSEVAQTVDRVVIISDGPPVRGSLDAIGPSLEASFLRLTSPSFRDLGAGHELR
jgi:ABC-2 type transport system ATP-binding protein